MCWGARQCWVGLLDTWQSVSLHPPSSLRTGLLLPLTEETEHLDLVTPHAASVTRACTSLDGRAGEAGAATGVVLQRELWELQRPLSHPCTVQLSAWLLVLQVKACLYSTSQVCQEACYYHQEHLLLYVTRLSFMGYHGRKPESSRFLL